MKKINLFLFFISVFCILNSAFSQNPLVKMWDKRFGGTYEDGLTSIEQISDGGFILAGWSISGISGDKTHPTFGFYDYWIVKTDSFGNKLWDRDFGGSDYDILHSIHQTYDGGFIIGGHSYSSIGGNKSQPLRGVVDYWIVKTDSLGNKIWDKDFGGTDWDGLLSVQQTFDGGFILGGHSNSASGFDKTQNTQGGVDYWIIKTDSIGNKLWDKDFGGTSDDYISITQQTSDGGFILGGYSYSGAGGDKSQSGWGFFDYWILKTDSLGTKIWDKDFGGDHDDFLCSIKQTSDGGFILAGISNSDVSGDKTQPLWGGTSENDIWILKLDSLGNKQWDQDIGGINSEDELGDILLTNDKGYLLSATSYSTISGDKTENNLGVEQTWISKIDSLGNQVWDKTIFTTGHDEQGLVVQTSENCYLFGNSTYGNIAGYKSQAPWNTGITDYWIVKFCDSISLPPIAATYSDQNLCPGSCIEFNNLSNYATSYQWSFPGANPNTSTDLNPANICYVNSGSFDVELVASNANGSDTLLLSNYITVYPTPPPQAITQSGDTLFSNAGAASYQWFLNGVIIPGATNYFYVATISGNYNVVAADNNGCEVEAAIFDVIASIQYTVDSRQLNIYPNPVTNEFTIQNLKITRGTAIEVSIYNVMNEKVYATSFQGNELTVDCKNFPSGIYFVEMSVAEKSFRTKFLKQ